MTAPIRPSWPTVVVACTAIAAAVGPALAGYPEHVDAIVTGALALIVPNTWRSGR